MTRETLSTSTYAKRLQNLHRLSRFITSGHVDTSATGGNVATHVLIGEPDTGHWVIPIAGGMDMLNKADAIRIETSVPNVATVLEAGTANLYISWPGADGQLREEPLDLQHAYFAAGEQTN